MPVKKVFDVCQRDVILFIYVNGLLYPRGEKRTSRNTKK
jgi:hypothetical protein